MFSTSYSRYAEKYYYHTYGRVGKIDIWMDITVSMEDMYDAHHPTR